MAAIRPITEEDIKMFMEFFTYIPETGSLTWKKKSGDRIMVGADAGTVRPNGYKHLSLGKRFLFVHRVRWCLATGMPIGAGDFIDHINGNRTDNRASNLRVVDHRTNVQNARKPNSRSSTGFLGVYVDNRANRGPSAFVARIGVTLESGKKKLLHLGSFDTPEAAHQAYLEAKRRLHPGCTI